MLGGGLKGVEVLFGLLKIQSVLLGIAKVDLSDGLDSAWVTLVTVPGYWYGTPNSVIRAMNYSWLS